MKWVNIGDVEEFDLYSKFITVQDNEMKYSNTSRGIQIARSSGILIHKLPKEITEAWVSFDLATPEGLMLPSYGALNTVGFDKDSSEKTSSIPCCLMTYGGLFTIYPKVGLGTKDYSGQIIYDPEVTWDFSDKKPHNIEIHVKTGSEGRIDVWFDHKLSFSYRSPSDFTDSIKYLKIRHGNFYYPCYYSSFILQDTRRIGYEKFVKLNIDPATEQNMPQGSTTTYTLSGLTDSSEYSDITGVVAVLQATSRDANISTGTYTLNGAKIGTIDVTDSSGRAYETAHAETNSVTGLPFTRDDIEGQTLSFTVNGAE